MHITDEQFGRFRLIERIALGGMGEVFLARYLNAAGIERLAIIKRILPHLTNDPDFVNYFLSEGRITSLLSHPNIVQTLELGRINNQYYIAMEFVPGHTLVHLLAAGMRERKPFSIPLIIHLASQLTSALEHIHNLTSIEGDPLDIVHMDLAPHNILVSPSGQLTLLDFGISRASGLPIRPHGREFRGRTAYLAPEQLDGLSIDRRTDLFALGIILHEMILCRPLFRVRSEHQTASRILHSPIPKLRAERPDCPEELEEIILRALRRDRDARYADAGEILQDLDRCTHAHGITHPATTMREELAFYLQAVRQHLGDAAKQSSARPNEEDRLAYSTK